MIQVFFSDETFSKMRGQEAVSSEYQKLLQVPHELQVVYEDDLMLIVNKPSGMLSQKASESDISLNESILSYLIHEGLLSEETYAVFHPSVANRLDRNTSGIVLAGKTLAGQQFLSDILRDRSAKKIYHCIVRGKVEEEMHLKGYLLKDERSNQVQIFSDETQDAKPIETAYRPLVVGPDATLLEVHLITGRSHQIRAHLASIGHPIAGDPKYGDMVWNKKLRQDFSVRSQLLHAYSITLPDGRTFIADEPEIFSQIMRG